MTTVKAWKHGQDGAPYFPEDFEIVKKAVLQVTDIKTNHNKYYAIEMHKAEEKSKVFFRVYTHYGRTDDLATNPLTTTVAAKITAHGIETPLGILTVGQIEKGEKILADAYELFQKKVKNLHSELERLSGDFYTAIPHRIGRTRAAIASAVID